MRPTAYRLRELIQTWEQTHGQRLSYRRLARETGLAYATIARLCDGTTQHPIRTRTRQQLCQFFGVAPADIG